MSIKNTVIFHGPTWNVKALAVIWRPRLRTAFPSLLTSSFRLRKRLKHRRAAAKTFGCYTRLTNEGKPELQSESIWKRAKLEQGGAAETKGASAFWLQMILVLFWKVQGDKKKSHEQVGHFFPSSAHPTSNLFKRLIVKCHFDVSWSCFDANHQSNYTHWTQPHPVKKKNKKTKKPLPSQWSLYY